MWAGIYHDGTNLPAQRAAVLLVDNPVHSQQADLWSAELWSVATPLPSLFQRELQAGELKLLPECAVATVNKRQGASNKHMGEADTYTK